MSVVDIKPVARQYETEEMARSVLIMEEKIISQFFFILLLSVAPAMVNIAVQIREALDKIHFFANQQNEVKNVYLIEMSLQSPTYIFPFIF